MMMMTQKPSHLVAIQFRPEDEVLTIQPNRMDDHSLFGAMAMKDEMATPRNVELREILGSLPDRDPISHNTSF